MSPGQSTDEGSGSAAGRTARAAYPHPVRLSLQDLPVTVPPSTAAATPRGPGFLALSLPPGRWAPPVTAHRELTLSLVSGVTLRTSGRLTDLLLPGDMSEIDPVATERWRVLSPDGAVILFLSPATVADMAAVPGVTHALLRARSRQHERCLELRSIVGTYDELGFSVGLWNGDRALPIGLSVTCGSWTAAPGVMNSVVLDLPVLEPGEAERLYELDTALCLMRAMVEAWQPDWATLTSYELADALDAGPREPAVGWITFLGDGRPVPSGVPARREELLGGTLLVSADRVEDVGVATAKALAEALYSAGSLTPTP